MRPSIRTAALAALMTLGAASLATSSAYAQGAGTQDAARDAAHDAAKGRRVGAAHGDMHARMQAMRQAHEAQRAQDLRTILRLRPDQEPALTAFLQSHKAPDRGSEGRPGGAPGGAPSMAMTTPQRLDMMAKREAEMAARRQRHVEALRTFYAALSPDQKPVFDALQRLGGHGHGHGGFGGHRFGHGPMGGGFGGPGPRDDE